MKLSARLLSWLAAGVVMVTIVAAVGVIAIAFVLRGEAPYPNATPFGDVIFSLFPSLVYSLVGGWIAIQRPRNLVGWALLIPSADIYGGALLFGYAELAVYAMPDAGIPGGVAAGAIAFGAWASVLAGAFLLLVIFPSGQMPSTRWRWGALGTLLTLALIWFLIATAPTLDPPYDDLTNPLALTGSDILPYLRYGLAPVCMLMLVVAAVHLIMRSRRSTGDEREQFKWLGFAAAFVALTLPLGFIDQCDGLGTVPFLVSLGAIPIAVAFAVLKYRLYDIDVIINRTLVYVPLTAVLAGLFVASTTLVRTIFTNLTDTGSDIAVAMSTLAVVAILTPLKNQLQAFVDRHFKERPDPFKVVSQLTTQGRSVVEVLDRDAYIERLLKEVGTALGAQGVELEYGPRRYVDGATVGEPALTEPLSGGDAIVGALRVWAPPQAVVATATGLPPAVSEAVALMVRMLSRADAEEPGVASGVSSIEEMLGAASPAETSEQAFVGRAAESTTR